jgi:hypothetical protein
MDNLTFRQVIFHLHEDGSDDAYEALEEFFYNYCPEDLDKEITLSEYLNQSMYI